MKVVILAGGGGTRMAADGDLAPKPMLEIGGRPILWHIMRSFRLQGFDDFIVAAGSQGDKIKRFFLDAVDTAGDLEIDAGRGHVARSGGADDDWRVRIVDTGAQTETGGRVARLRPLLEAEPFIVTYGDSVSDVDVSAVVEHHRRRGHLVTVTAVRPPSRFGGIRFDGDKVAGFVEKPQIGEGWINGGFAVFDPAVFDHPAMAGDGASLNGLFETLTQEKRLGGYRHEGFWLAADTLRALKLLEGLWESGDAPWMRPPLAGSPPPERMAS
ncbi:sugar phosphate nucleotidyltransferase [Phreatobacter sp.]|uniref:sugar phosphate nucleotidyltransferase n=1 Tax=Phreatobacter sp. TaxID=1966341 RepID=UPI0022C8CE76|nr:sugar phosphate nucleotidyltransferase [Phreatobacter sp.]MCZ8314081.1 sugar phosphate nucleotidyltransferase [Phreatobacter sp.]